MLLTLEAYRLVENLSAESAADARRALLHTSRASEPLRVVLRGHRSRDGETVGRPERAAAVRPLAAGGGPLGFSPDGTVVGPATEWRRFLPSEPYRATCPE